MKVKEQKVAGTQVVGRGATVGVQVGTDRKGRLGLKSDAVATRQAWYLKREGELAAVTEAHENLALGITKLEVFEATPAQIDAGILCKVRMHSLTGIDENINIRESNRPVGEIYLQLSGAREVGKTETQKGKWYIDRKLTRACEAQILSFISTLLVVVE